MVIVIAVYSSFLLIPLAIPPLLHKGKKVCSIHYTMKESESESLSCVRLCVTSWAIQSMEFSRLEYWSG